MKNMDNGPERQAVIDDMLEIARHDAPWIWGFLPQGLQPAPRLGARTSSPTRWPTTRSNTAASIPALRERPARRMEPAGAVAALGLLVGRAGGRASRRRWSACAAAGKADGLMIAYILRRLLYAIPILIGVNLLTFALFFVVNTPDDMARMQLGAKRVTPEAIAKLEARARLRQAAAVQRRRRRARRRLTDTIFFENSVRLFAFDFGHPTTGATSATTSARACGRAWPSRCRCSWSGWLVNITFALLMVFFRATYLDLSGRGAVRGDDVDLRPVLHHRRAVPGQQAAGTWLPISGFDGGIDGLKFLILPVVVGVIGGIGSGRALVSHHLPRGNRQGLCAHRARQGSVGAARAVPPCAEECA